MNTYFKNTLLRDPVVKYREINLYTEEMDFTPRTTEEKEIDFDYIMGNPPFIGARLMSEEQKDDVLEVFGKNWKNVGNLGNICHSAESILRKKKICADRFPDTGYPYK